MSATEATLDNEMLNLLTPEERAAIEGDKPTDDEIASLKSIAGDDTEDDDVREDDEGAADADDAAPQEGAAAKSQPAAAAEEDPAPASERTFRPEYVATLPDDYAERVSKLSEDAKALAVQFKAGEIDVDEFQTQSEALADQRHDLTLMRAKAEMSSEMRTQASQQTWENQVKEFIATTAKSEGIDYRTDMARQADFDLMVKALANNPANADKDASWFLTEGHRRVKALHGDPATPTKQFSAEEVKDAAVKRRKVDPGDAPKNLAQVPGGDGPGDVGGEFAHLDALGGDELEAAIAKMSPAAREKYSRGL